MLLSATQLLLFQDIDRIGTLVLGELGDDVRHRHMRQILQHGVESGLEVRSQHPAHVAAQRAFRHGRIHAGHDFEAEEIESRLRSYEEKYRDDYEIEDPEAAEQKAWEEYQKDKVARQALKEKRNQ